MGGTAALGDGYMAGLQQRAVFKQGQVGGENRFLVDPTLRTGGDQSELDFFAHLLKSRIQRQNLLRRDVIAGVGRQLYAGQIKQRTADQAGGGAYTAQLPRFVVGPYRCGCRDMRGGSGSHFAQRSQKRLQRGTGILAFATDLHLVLLADTQCQ